MLHVKSHLWQFWKNLLGCKMYLPVSYAARRYWFKDQERQIQYCWHFLKGQMQNVPPSEPGSVSEIIFLFASLFVCKTMRRRGVALQWSLPLWLCKLSAWTPKKSVLNQICFHWFILQSSWVSQKCHSKQIETETLAVRRYAVPAFLLLLWWCKPTVALIDLQQI